MNNLFSINREKLFRMLEGNEPSAEELNTILNKAQQLHGLDLEDSCIASSTES